jgi:hypothetical protein
MPFGAATVVTNIGKAMFCDRMKASPSTYTNPPKYVAMGVGATGAARTAGITDTALSTEVETRTSGTESTQTTTTTGDTYQVVGTVTATSTRAVDEMGLFDASSSGNMGFSATFAVVNLSSGDSIQFTAKSQLT